MKRLSYGLFALVLTITLLLAGCKVRNETNAVTGPHPRTSSITLLESVKLGEDWYVTIVHDDQRLVTCYLYSRGSFCLPDSALAKPSPESAPTERR